MELLMLFLALAYTTLLLLPVQLVFATIAWRGTLARESIRKCIGTTSIITCMPLLVISVLHGDPEKGMGVVCMALGVAFIVSVILAPLLYAASLRFSHIVTIVSISAVLLFIALSGYSAIAVQLAFNDFLSYVLGTTLIGIMLAAIGLSVWLVRIGNPYRCVTFTLISLWVSLGITGVIYFRAEATGIENFAGIEQEIARKEIEYRWNIDPYLGTYELRIRDIEIADSDRFLAYYARLEAYSWMRIPVYFVHVHVNNQGERSVEWQKTWWEKWVP